MSVAAGAAYLWRKSRIRAFAVLSLGAGGICLGGLLMRPAVAAHPVAKVRVAGVQMEFPTENEVRLRLNDLIRSYPDTELVVLSEYTFDGPVPAAVKEWCRDNRRYLIVGGKDPAPGGNFYDTAFVVGPGGDIVFRQVKAVPIQFFKDGLPAPEQKLWESPWGKIGICVCYDLSYTRVTDRLVRLGAQALIVPTMDMVDWGQAQHELHARIAPVRATEYGLPIFRVASSGISQLVDRAGQRHGHGALSRRRRDPCRDAGTARCRQPAAWTAGSRPSPSALTAVLIVWFLAHETAADVAEGDKYAFAAVLHIADTHDELLLRLAASHPLSVPGV